MIEVDNRKCDVCGTCVAVCPTAALRLVERIEVDLGRCTRCLACVKVCPVAALSCGSQTGEGHA